MVFQCLALQDLRGQYASLFQNISTMRQFFWQDDLVSVAKFVQACLHRMHSNAPGLSSDGQASDQPDVAGRDVM